MLDFLCLDLHVVVFPDLEREKKRDYLAKISKFMLGQNARPVPEILDSQFFDIISQAYIHHLQAEVHLFGREICYEDDPTYYLAFDKYTAEVKENVQAWVDNRIDHVNQHPTKFPSTAVRILKGLLGRMHYVLDCQVFNQYHFGLLLATPIPLMCRVVLDNLGANLESLMHWIMEVFVWMEPLVYATFKDTKAGHGGFDDISHMLITWLKRQGLDTDRNPERWSLNKASQHSPKSHKMWDLTELLAVISHLSSSHARRRSDEAP